MPSKPRVFSGVQPTGKLHVGNYIGALKQWSDNLDSFDNIFCVVDNHAISIPEVVDPKQLREKSREIAAIFIASGVDPDKAIIFIQSSVPEHTILAWTLTCCTPLGWLERMTQYKMKAGKQESVGAGLLMYPVLQAADILLYDADKVPVGEDQKQHIEITRDIALRFNNLFGEVFKVPETMLPPTGARVMGLDEPDVKMSKSIGVERPLHAIGILDEDNQWKKAVMSAKTDSDSVISFEKGQSGVINLLTIYQALTGLSKQQIEAEFEGQGYGSLKKALLESVHEKLGPVRAEARRLLTDPGALDKVLETGTAHAREMAIAKVKQVHEAVGFTPYTPH